MNKMIDREIEILTGRKSNSKDKITQCTMKASVATSQTQTPSRRASPKSDLKRSIENLKLEGFMKKKILNDKIKRPKARA